MKKNNMINVTQLTPNSWVKNYKELCKLLDQPVRGGYQKIAQLENFKRYFSYEKQGWKYYIKEIYDTPLPSDKVSANAKYGEYIQNILLSYLSKQPRKQTNMKKAQLYQMLGMVNENYYTYHRSKKLQTLFPTVQRTDVTDFYQRADSRLNQILKVNLNSLQKRGFLTWYETYVIGMLGPRAETLTYHEANEYEIQLIESESADVLNELKLHKMTEVYMTHQEEKYYDLLSCRIKEYGWSTAFKTYHFETKMQVEAKEGYRDLLNRLIIEALDTQAVSRFEKEQAALNTDIANPQLKYPESYVQAQKTLSSNLIKL